MRSVIIILFLSSLSGCIGRNITISSIERKVYVRDSILSNTVAHFNIGVVESYINDFKETLEKHTPDSTLKSGKYAEYSIVFSDSSRQILKYSTQIAVLDNYMVGLNSDFSVLSQDSTFHFYFWDPETEVEIIIIPSSEFHK